jgi:hypothetical protein
MIRDAENVRHCFILSGGSRKCLDCTISGRNAELVYESGLGVINLSNIAFSYRMATGCRNMFYCALVFGLQDCFGCANLRNKQYCILNKQYSEAEYNQLVPKIIEHMTKTGEWGEFFPINHSPIPYNRSLANRYFPLSKEETIQKGFWYYDMAGSQSNLTAVPDEIEDDLNSLDAISQVSGRPFRITQEEINKLRKLRAPLPVKSYDLRMQDRAKYLGGVSLIERTCAKSGVPIQTAYGEDIPWKIWESSVYSAEFDG